MTLFKYTKPIALLLLFMNSCQQKYNLSAKIENLGNDTVFVELGTVTDFFSGKKPKRDTIYSKNGKFTYNSSSQEAQFVYFYPKKSVFTRSNGRPFYANQNYIVILIEPNNKIKVIGKLHKYYINYQSTGSSFNENYSKLRSTHIVASSKAAELELKIDSLSSIDGSRVEIDKLFKDRTDANRLSRRAELKYIADNPDTDLSAFLLTRQGTRVFDQYYPSLSDNVKNGVFEFGLITKLKKIDKIKKAKSIIKIGNSAPNFVLRSLNNENIELYSIKKKFIVLDFWGSWCPPCIKGFPKMKKYYSKYKENIEFIGIACNDTEKKWREAIDKYNIRWTQLFNSNGLDKDVSVLYGIRNYPTKILLDDKKNIIGVFTGESQKFYNQLDELVK